MAPPTLSVRRTCTDTACSREKQNGYQPEPVGIHILHTHAYGCCQLHLSSTALYIRPSRGICFYATDLAEGAQARLLALLHQIQPQTHGRHSSPSARGHCRHRPCTCAQSSRVGSWPVSTYSSSQTHTHTNTRTRTRTRTRKHTHARKGEDSGTGKKGENG